MTAETLPWSWCDWCEGETPTDFCPVCDTPVCANCERCEECDSRDRDDEYGYGDDPL